MSVVPVIATLPATSFPCYVSHSLSVLQDFAENTGYTGSVEKTKREPFKDGWTSRPQAPKKASASASAAPPAETAAPPQESNNIVGFLGKAAERVVAHNFTGDTTEPTHWQDKSAESTRTGFSGKIRTRDSEGFHASKK